MLFDIFFFGIPTLLAVIFGFIAVQRVDNSYWRAAFSLIAYCAFYLAGGREVLLYLTVAFMMAGGCLVH